MGRARKKVDSRKPIVDSGSARVDGIPPVALALGLAILTFLAYSNSFDAALTMDSPTLVERDTRLREASEENLHLIWTKNYWWPSRPSNLFRPMTTLSFLFNYTILGNGTRPGGYHAVNLLLHALNVGLAFGVVRRVAGSPAVAAFAAAIFALHPIATEAVTNVAGRADLLAAAAVLGGLWLHIESTRRPNPWPWRAALLVTTLFGVFAKESAVVVIPAIVLYDILGPRAGERPRLGRLEWPSYAALAVAFVALLAARRSALADMGYYRDHFMDNPLVGGSFLASRLTALKVMGLQLWKLVWPMTLSCDYSYDQIPLFGRGGGLEDAKAIVSAVVVGIVLAAAWVTRRRQPALAFFVLFYFATLLPTSNLLLHIGSIMAERFLYLPSVGFAAAVAIGVHTALRGRTPYAVAGVLVLLYAGRTYVRNEDGRTEDTLFEASRRTSPRSYKTHKGVANALLAGKPTGPPLDRAIEAAETGLRIIDARPVPPVDQPSDLMAALGLAYVMKGDSLGGGKTGEAPPPVAAEWYHKAVAVMERAVATDRAVNERVKRLKLESGAPPEEIRDVGLRRVHGTLGNAYMRLGEHGKALETFTHLRRLDPLRADGYTQSAWALYSSGRLDEAAVLLIQAMFLDPQSGAGSLLGDVYRHMEPPVKPAPDGSLDRSEPRVKTHVARACVDLVRLYREAGRIDEASDLRGACVGRYGVAPALLE